MSGPKAIRTMGSNRSKIVVGSALGLVVLAGAAVLLRVALEIDWIVIAKLSAGALALGVLIVTLIVTKFVIKAKSLKIKFEALDELRPTDFKDEEEFPFFLGFVPLTEDEKRRALEVLQAEEARRRAEAARHAEEEIEYGENERIEPPRQAANERGSIFWNPPGRMRVGQGERIEVRLGDPSVAVAKLRNGLRGRGEPRIDHLEVAPLMRVELMADPDDFSIRALSNQDQFVRPGTVARWDFDVTPLRGGLRRIHLLASMRIRIEGKEEVVDLPSYETEVKVVVAPARAVGLFCRKNWQWIAGTVAIPIVVWATSNTGLGSAILNHLRGWLNVH
jgi:hypothetical protein